MVQVDMVCDPELLPRLRLLVKHMQLLDVRLKLHLETPRPSPAVLLVAATEAYPIRVRRTADQDLIRVYLEAEAVQQPADYHIHIPTWPARSSDPAVEELAAHLTRVTSSQHKSQRAAASLRREKRTNRLLLGSTLALLGLLVFWERQDDSVAPPAESLEVQMTEQQIAEASWSDPAIQLESPPSAHVLATQSFPVTPLTHLLTTIQATAQATAQAPAQAPPQETRLEATLYTPRARQQWYDSTCPEHLLPAQQSARTGYSCVLCDAF